MYCDISSTYISSTVDNEWNSFTIQQIDRRRVDVLFKIIVESALLTKYVVGG